jgi:hypothetical protein
MGTGEAGEIAHLLGLESVVGRALWREGFEGLWRVARAVDENVDLNEVGCQAGAGGLVVHIVPDWLRSLAENVVEGGGGGGDLNMNIEPEDSRRWRLDKIEVGGVEVPPVVESMSPANDDECSLA